jgi:hypothetical protein
LMAFELEIRRTEFTAELNVKLRALIVAKKCRSTKR